MLGCYSVRVKVWAVRGWAVTVRVRTHWAFRVWTCWAVRVWTLSH